jgi:hypothetical protein
MSTSPSSLNFIWPA